MTLFLSNTFFLLNQMANKVLQKLKLLKILGIERFFFCFVTFIHAPNPNWHLKHNLHNNDKL